MQDQGAHQRPANAPTWISAWAVNIRELPGGLWLWEFSGGATLHLAYQVNRSEEPCCHTSIEGATFQAFLTDLSENLERYQQALAAEVERQRAYEAVIGSGYEPDEG